MASSLYQKYGGAAAVSLIVRDFYRRLMDDSSVSGYFDGVNLPGLIAHQSNFVGRALGGPEVHAGRELKAAHASLEIDDAAFGAVAGHLNAALLMSGEFSEEDATAVIELIASLKDDVVTAKAD